MKFCRSIFIALIAVLSVFSTAVSSDSNADSLAPYIHDVWQTDQGLPQNSVVAILQTRDGYIWLATQEGLVRFDGIRFTVFDKRNTPQIKENNIQALCPDSAASRMAASRPLPLKMGWSMTA